MIPPEAPGAHMIPAWPPLLYSGSMTTFPVPYPDAPFPADETERLAALRHLDILDTGEEEEFNRIVDLAVSLFGTAAAVISLVDHDRQWFKAVRGLGVTQTPRNIAFCAHTILQDGVCLVNDARQDARFAANPLVTGAPGIRFYAGAPLRTESGYKVGTLCLIDFHPRQDFGPAEQTLLVKLAAIASDELALRASKIQLKVLAEAEAKARRAAEEASTIKADFVQTMAHEVRTPLGGIIGMAEMLVASSPPGAPSHYAATLKEAADHLLLVVNNVLDFSKLEAGALEYDPLPCNLTELVESAVSVLAARAHECGLGIGAVFDPGVPRQVVCDTVRLRQILLNLIGNALKFTNYGGVYVTVSPAGPEQDGTLPVRFEIRDTGIGMRQEDLPRLFKRFSQLQPGTARNYGGTGLGLAICHRLVRLMQGSISVQSEPGKGSVFAFTLPLKLQPGALPPPCPLTGRHVLIAEQNPVERHVLQRQAEAMGAETMATEQPDAIDALLRQARLEGRAFDTLIISQENATQLGAEAALGEGNNPFGPVNVIQTVHDGQHGDWGRLVMAKPVTEANLAAALQAAWPAPVQPAAAVPAPAQVRHRLHILLAEDNEINQIVASALFSSIGHDITIAQNGAEAIAAAATGQHDLILMDMMMPDIDGPAAARAIRRLRGPQGGIYIVALTASTSAEHRQQCLDAGMNDFITKPVTRKQLAEALDRYFAWAAAQGESTP